MTNIEMKETAKARLEEYLNIITTKKGSQYICPVCGSGTGKNKTPAGSITPDKQSYHCFSCEFHGDIFDLIGQVEGIIDQADKFNRTYEILNIHTEQNRRSSPINTDVLLSSELAVTDLTDYYRECHTRAEETDYFAFRGISKTTVDKFMLGFDPAWRSPKALREGKNPPASSRIIIPTTNQSYVARATDRNADPKYKSIKEGISELFNREALWGIDPVFVVEGEIDALSVLEVGYQAVALGSTSNKRKLIELCQTTPPLVTVILSLDNDEAGKKAQGELKNELEPLKIPVLEANISGAYKDPNEALTTNRGLFLQAVNDAVTYAMQYAQEIEETKKSESEARRKKYIDETSVTAKIDDFIGQIKANADTPVIPTGFTELDDILDEGLYEGLYIIGAISSLGKTSFALQVADQIAQQGQDVLIFTLEMAKTELMAKSISRITYLECKGNANHAKTTRGITAGKRYASYSKDERSLIDNSIKIYSGYTDCLFIYEGVGDIGTAQVREIVETHVKVTGHKPVIVIDYLQILTPQEQRGSDKQNTDKAVFELKRLSRDYKIPVIAISSLNRENYTTAINMSAFKESGAVEYSSDVLLGLQLVGAGKDNFDANAEKKKDPRQIELKVLKNRNGAMGDSVYFDYYPKFNYFKETIRKVNESSIKTNGKRI